MPKQLRTTMSSEECKAVRHVLLICTNMIKQNMDLTTLYAIGGGVMTGEEFLAHIAAARKLVPTSYALRLLSECPHGVRRCDCAVCTGVGKPEEYGYKKGAAGLRGEVAGRKRKSTDRSRMIRAWKERRKQYGPSGQRIVKSPTQQR